MEVVMTTIKGLEMRLPNLLTCSLAISSQARMAVISVIIRTVSVIIATEALTVAIIILTAMAIANLTVSVVNAGIDGITASVATSFQTSYV